MQFTHTFKSISLSIALASGALMAAASAQADGFTPVNVPIVNGSLEAQTGANYSGFGTAVIPDGWSVLAPGGESWTNFGSQPSPDGGNYWGIGYVTGWGADRFNAGGIAQSINGLVVGATYTVSFYSMANHTDDPVANEHWDVSFGDTTNSGATVDAANPGQWTQSTLSFVANATQQVLQFAAVYADATPGVSPEILNLDGITVTQVSAVPEPSAATLGLAGLAALGFLFTRRSKRQ